MTLEDELVACQRYYEKSFGLSTTPGTSSGGTYHLANAWGANSVIGNSVRFSVTKRVAPTMTFYDDTGTAGQTRAIIGGSAVYTAISAGTIQKSEFDTSLSPTVTAGSCILTYYAWVASAEI